MTEKEKRDRNFRRLCKWFDEAQDIAEILCEEFPEHISKTLQRLHSQCGSPEEVGIASVYQLLSFLTWLYRDPINNEGEPDNQRNEYPELAFGLMEIARRVGIMKLNDEDKSGFGI